MLQKRRYVRIQPSWNNRGLQHSRINCCRLKLLMPYHAVWGASMRLWDPICRRCHFSSWNCLFPAQARWRRQLSWDVWGSGSKGFRRFMSIEYVTSQSLRVKELGRYQDSLRTHSVMVELANKKESNEFSQSLFSISGSVVSNATLSFQLGASTLCVPSALQAVRPRRLKLNHGRILGFSTLPRPVSSSH